VSELYPPLPPDLVAFAEGGVSLLVATASATHEPDCVRAVGLRIWPGASQLTVLVPAATSVTSLANLRTNPRLALTMSQIPSHRTLQVKGNVTAIREGDDADRELATRYRARFANELAFIGNPVANTSRLGIWPCFAIDLDITIVYAQTPGPQAGVRLTPATRGAL
jgi:hypothetical protein